MVTLFQKKPAPAVVGIDVGTSSIKLVQLAAGESGPRLVTFGLATKEKASLLVDQQLQAAADLRSLLTQARVTTDLAVGALPATSVFNTIIDFPAMTEKETNSAIQWEAKKLIPLPLDKVSLHWQILPPDHPSQQPGKESQKIILSAAPRELINRYLALFRAANLRLATLETEHRALQRSLVSPHTTTLVIDIGTSATNLILYHHDLPLMSRNVAIGGESFSRTIANTLNITAERAEQMKSTFGLPTESYSVHPVIKALQFAVDTTIVQEIRYLLRVIQPTVPKPPAEIVLTGGGCSLRNIEQYLERMVGIPTHTGDPWRHVSYPEELRDDLRQIGPQMAVAIGLALHGG
ncbi:MAG: type IV pilus assembly protein PilM [Patescibacteria group bacterium]